ncbi:UNVERIFIED_CONTAM: site-specific recombinase XerD [Acetivibrio alkalicellulosi]
MSKLKENFIRDMQLKGYRDKTQKSYLMHLKGITRYYRKSPEYLGSEEIKNYMYYMLNERGYSNDYIRGCYSALRFFYTTTLQKEWSKFSIPQARRKRKLPEVMSIEEIDRLFNVTKNLKHKAILMIIYSSGLRVSEGCNLRIGDIDSKRMAVRVRSGKGDKDRYTILSELALENLRIYWKEQGLKNNYNNDTYLFPGGVKGKPLTTRTVQRVFKEAKNKAGIIKDVTVHSLRHSFATHMLELKNDVYHIQKLLGHKTVKTTSRYIHISQQRALNIKSPMDVLGRL